MLTTARAPRRNRLPPASSWGPRVDASRARRHLLWLQSNGVGKDPVADATGLVPNTVARIRVGRTRLIYARTESLILGVRPCDAADHALVDAAPTWALIEDLVEEGYLRCTIARLLGYTGNGIQLSRTRISNRNAYRVKVLHEALTSEARRPIPRLATTQRSRWRKS